MLSRVSEAKIFLMLLNNRGEVVEVMTDLALNSIIMQVVYSNSGKLAFAATDTMDTRDAG